MANSLVELIKQRKAQIAKLQAELDEALEALTQGRTAPRPAMAPSKPAARPKGKRAGGTNVGQPGIVPTSSVGLTVEVLRQAGKPMHVNDIIRAIEESGHKVSKTTLVGNLSRYVKKKHYFYRPAPSVFGLLESRR